MGDWELTGKLALLVLHMQHDIVGQGGKCEPLGFPRACRESGIVPRIQSLIKAFRSKKLPVIYVVAEYNPIVREPAYGHFYGFLGKEKPNSPNSTGLQIIPEVAPEWGEPVVRNWNVGIFSNSTLEQTLKHYGAETLVMVGVATNMVVHIGTVQATDNGYSVIVVGDAVTSNDSEAHDYTLNKVLPMFSQVTTTRELLAKLKQKSK